jgi:hypothetical protein
LKKDEYGGQPIIINNLFDGATVGETGYYEESSGLSADMVRQLNMQKYSAIAQEPTMLFVFSK